MTWTPPAWSTSAGIMTCMGEINIPTWGRMMYNDVPLKKQQLPRLGNDLDPTSLVHVRLNHNHDLHGPNQHSHLGEDYVQRRTFEKISSFPDWGMTEILPKCKIETKTAQAASAESVLQKCPPRGR